MHYIALNEQDSLSLLHKLNQQQDESYFLYHLNAIDICLYNAINFKKYLHIPFDQPIEMKLEGPITIDTFSTNQNRYQITISDSFQHTVTLDTPTLYEYVEVSSALSPLYSGSPWEALGSMAYAIVHKPSQYLNALEQKHFELFQEIAIFHYAHYIYFLTNDEQSLYLHFKILPAYAKKYKKTKLLKLFHQYNVATLEKRKDALQNLINELNKIKYHSFFQGFYQIIKESQKDYPLLTQQMYSEHCLQSLHHQIDNFMQQHDYVGTFPNYQKVCKQTGIKLLKAYHHCYYMYHPKYLSYHLHCDEIYLNNQLYLQFQCGMNYQKNRQIDNILTLGFNQKDKGFLTTYTILYEESEARLGHQLNLLLKVAQREKLSKEERDETMIELDWFSFFVHTVLGGFLFALIMTVIILGVLAIIQLDLIQYLIPDILPIFFLFMFGYGIPFGLIELFARE